MMARAKGTPKTGGRAKGTPNKTTSTVKEWLSGLLDNNRAQIEEDLRSIEPAERIKVFALLLNYIIPKRQTVSIEAEMEAEYNELTKLLESAPERAIDRIAERIKEIEDYKNGK